MEPKKEMHFALGTIAVLAAMLFMGNHYYYFAWGSIPFLNPFAVVMSMWFVVLIIVCVIAYLAYHVYRLRKGAS